jgi:hypothetical protein
LGDPPTYYDLTTTNVFTGSIEVCINYSGISYTDESQLKLLHFEDDLWADRTTSLDTDADIICGSVTSLSPFIVAEPVTTFFFSSMADTYLKKGQPNQNQSGETILRVLGGNRALVQFPQAVIASAASAGLASAKLLLYIEDNANNWGSDGRTVGAHRMTQAWSETGATWNCPADSIPTNSRPDCVPTWDMDGFTDWPFMQAPTSIALHENGQTGWVEWDVTADVAAFLDGSAANLGWLIRRTDEGPSGRVDYSSREGEHPPQLVVMTGAPPPPPSPTLTSAGDTYLKQGQPNQNQGYETILRVQASGNNRALVQIDQGAIEQFVGEGAIESAKLRLHITDNTNNWGGGRPVNVHRMLMPWTEFGSTWNCPDDDNPVNTSPDCSPDWEMAQSSQWPFAATPTSSVLHTNGLTGWVEWDVTTDVEAFLSGAATNNGWIIKKDQEGEPGQVDYSSRQGQFRPELVIALQIP